MLSFLLKRLAMWVPPVMKILSSASRSKVPDVSMLKWVMAR